MGKRGPKPQFTDVACPNHSCKSYGLTGEGNIVGNGISVSRGEKVRKYICRHCGKVFNDHTGTFYYDLRTQFQNPVMKISVTPLHKIYNSILI